MGRFSMFPTENLCIAAFIGGFLISLIE